MSEVEILKERRKGMEKHVVIENAKNAYFVMQYLDDDGKKLTNKMVRDRDFSGEVHNVCSVYCPECNSLNYQYAVLSDDKGFVYPKHKFSPKDMYAKLDRFGELPEKGHKLICPDCGAVISDYKSATLARASINNGSNLLRSIHVFEPSDDKLVISAFVSYYYPNTFAEKLIVIPVRYRLVFNYKEGMTYFLQGRTVDGKHPKFDSTPEIFNATLGGKNSCPEIVFLTSSKELIKEAAEALLEVHHGRKEQLTKIGDFSDTTFIMLATYNNLPYFNYDFYRVADIEINNLNLWHRQPRDRFTYRLRTIKTKYLADDVFVFEKFLFKGIKANTKKAVRKLIFENPMLVDVYRLLLKSGFKNPDVIRAMLSEDMEISTRYLIEYNNNEKYCQEYIVKFIKKLIKVKGEIGARKFLSSSESDLEYLRDTASMFVIFDERKMFKNTYMKGDLRKVHDELSKDYRKVKEKNLKINYKPDFYKLEDTIDGFEFKLMKNTYEMIDVGQEMHICVGSYGNSAVAGRCVILTMSKGNKHVGCIELSSDGKRLVQAKACFNNLLQEKKAEVLKQWIEKNKINTSSCYDYAHIKEDNIEYDEDKIYQGRHDYANYYVGDVAREAMRVMDVEGAEDDGDLFF